MNDQGLFLAKVFEIITWPLLTEGISNAGPSRARDRADAALGFALYFLIKSLGDFDNLVQSVLFQIPPFDVHNVVRFFLVGVR